MKEEEVNTHKAEKAEQAKMKVHKDFGFLLDLQPQIISTCTVKYLLEKGQGQPVKEIKFPFEAYYNIIKYDYQGRILDKNNALTKLNSDRLQKFRQQVLSMAIKQRAWFNISDIPIHKVPAKIEQIEDGFITEDIIDDFEQEIEEQENTTPDNKPITGYHYQIFLERIEYKNGESIEVKRLVNEQNREKGRNLFREGKYTESAKVYKFIINISENLSKKKYQPEEIGQLDSMNISAKFNYLRCYFKLTERWVEKELEEFTSQVVKSLLKARPYDHNTHYWNAKWLLRERVLDNALAAARKSNDIKKEAGTDTLIKEILFQKANKGKIKIEKEIYNKMKE